jgi:hypothetical protein
VLLVYKGIKRDGKKLILFWSPQPWSNIAEPGQGKLMWWSGVESFAGRMCKKLQNKTIAGRMCKKLQNKTNKQLHTSWRAEGASLVIVTASHVESFLQDAPQYCRDNGSKKKLTICPCHLLSWLTLSRPPESNLGLNLIAQGPPLGQSIRGPHSNLLVCVASTLSYCLLQTSSSLHRILSLASYLVSAPGSPLFPHSTSLEDQ